MNAAWTPAVRPGEAGHRPTHARLDGAAPALLPSLLSGRQRWPVPRPPADEPSRLLDDPLLAPWREQLAGLDDPWPAGPAEVAEDPLDLPPPPPPAVVASLLGAHGSRPRDDDTMPLALVPLPRAEEPGPRVHSLETPPRGLRKFDLGTVPASVTPPPTWRKAAWFAVGTSAAVVCGLAIAAVRLVGAPSPAYTIDALPAYPTQPLEIEQLPVQETSDAPDTGERRRSAPSTPSSSDQRDRPGTGSVPGSEDAAAAGSSADTQVSESAEEPGTSSASIASELADPPRPTRITVGPAPVMPTDPQQMGDRTEQYFALVTEDPEAAHELCAGGMAKEGPQGIEARYEGVERVEVQEIVIDRNQGVTTSRVKVIREDGTEAIEERELTFTWGGNPKISDETTAG